MVINVIFAEYPGKATPKNLRQKVCVHNHAFQTQLVYTQMAELKGNIKEVAKIIYCMFVCVFVRTISRVVLHYVSVCVSAPALST